MALKQSAGELAFRFRVGAVLAALGAVAGAGGYLYWLAGTAQDTSAWGLSTWGRWVYLLILTHRDTQAQPVALAAVAGVLLLLIPFLIFLTKSRS